MISEQRIKEAERWLRANDEITFDPESEGLQAIRDIWQAIREGYTLRKGDEDEWQN